MLIEKSLLLLLLLFSAAAFSQQMAITFDDLPAHGEKPVGISRLDIAQSILSTLKQEAMPPTYGFINGEQLEDDASSRAVLKAWRAAGQFLGNHTWAHSDLNKESAEQFEGDAAKVEPLLKQLMGDEDWHWFRYPYLHEGDTVDKRRAVRRWLAKHKYKIAEVTMSFEDYLWNAPYARCTDSHDEASIRWLHDSYLATADEYFRVFRQLSRMAYGRDVKYVLLMHVGAFDARMLPELLALYRSKGASFISLPAAASDPIYRIDPDMAEPNGGTLLELIAEKQKLPFQKSSNTPYRQLEAICR